MSWSMKARYMRSVSRSVSVVSEPQTRLPWLRRDKRSAVIDPGLGIDHGLLSPRRAWDEATLDALASGLPAVHSIEPQG